MAIRATLSVLGLYNFDDTLFDEMVLPQGVDKEIVVGDILKNCADLEIGIADWDLMHYQIKIWSKKNLWSWTKLFESTQFVYNPIWNKDGEIRETLQAADEGGGTNTGTVTAENSVSGYNVNQYSPESKNVTTPDTAWSESRQRGETRVRTEKGNIGVTSTQQLIKEEREISDFSIYEVITQSFKKEFCVLVY